MRLFINITSSRLLIVLAVLCYMWGGLSLPHIYAEAPIVVGTSAIHSAVKDLCGAQTELAVVVPPDLCPGHFDLKPGDVEKFINAKLIILHTWQKDLPAIKSLLRGTNPPEEKVVYIQLEGGWLVPKNYIVGLEKVGEALVKTGLLTEDNYKKQLKKRKTEISNFEQQVLTDIKKIHPETITVISSIFQSDFVNWLGFRNIATFPRAEDLSLSFWGELLHKGKTNNVKLVIENLQSGEIELVKRLASELKAQSVVLSGFPYTCPTCNSWEVSVQNNIDILLKTVNNTH